jgi:hypothetical protein
MSPFFTSSSKAEFERQLNRARPADLIESVHAAQTVIKGCGGQPEAPYAAGHLVVGRTKIAVIKYIEELAAELQIDAFREIELTMKRKVHLPGTKNRAVRSGLESPELGLGSHWRPWVRERMFAVSSDLQPFSPEAESTVSLTN